METFGTQGFWGLVHKVNAIFTQVLKDSQLAEVRNLQFRGKEKIVKHQGSNSHAVK